MATDNIATYAALRYQDNLYLVREPVEPEPDHKYFSVDEGEYAEAVHHYRLQFESAPIIPPEHVDVFKGRTGIPESKFEILYQLYDGDFWIVVPKHQYDKDKDFEKRIVAIPKEPGAGHNRFVGDRFAPIKVSFEEATLIPEGEEGRWIAYMDDYAGMCCAGKTKEEAFDELMISLKVKIAYDNNIELTRKNP